jgi:hypothetical protein
LFEKKSAINNAVGLSSQAENSFSTNKPKKKISENIAHLWFFPTKKKSETREKKVFRHLSRSEVLKIIPSSRMIGREAFVFNLPSSSDEQHLRQGGQIG